MKRYIFISFILFVSIGLSAVPARRLHKMDFCRPAKAVCRLPQRVQVGELKLPPAVPVILAEFSDLSFKEENGIAAFDSLFNSDNYIYDGATGSVRQYFIDQSFGKYSPRFDIIGKVTLSNSVTYYGQNKNNIDGEDMHSGEMIAEACSLADSKYDVDFSKYDADGDGEVDAVYVVYAGYGEADGGESYTIWPHNWTIKAAGGTPPTLDGKKVSVYVCSGEIFNEYWDRQTDIREGIGIMCHEFSHVLGLPDAYTTNGAAHKTLGNWDIMDIGAYNNNSCTPPSYSAYERFFMGWTTPVILNEANTIDMQNINTEGECYLISANGTHNLNGVEPSPTVFYLLENRQQQGWDKYIPGNGMMVTKINYDKTRWTNNKVNNNSTNMGIDLVEADSSAPAHDGTKNGYYGKPTDLYPAGATLFTPYEKYPVTDIEQTNGIVRFRFMGGKTIAPDTYFNVTFDTEYAVAIGDATAKVGEDYTALLIADEGYYIDDAAITMGFTDLTKDVDYTIENGVLTIFNVQDELYILVIATKKTTTETNNQLNTEIIVNRQQITLLSGNTEKHVAIYNQIGQLVNFATFINKYEVSLAQGLYFVAITDKNEQLTKIIIIK